MTVFIIPERARVPFSRHNVALTHRCCLRCCLLLPSQITVSLMPVPAPSSSPSGVYVPIPVASPFPAGMAPQAGLPITLLNNVVLQVRK